MLSCRCVFGAPYDAAAGHNVDLEGRVMRYQRLVKFSSIHGKTAFLPAAVLVLATALRCRCVLRSNNRDTGTLPCKIWRVRATINDALQSMMWKPCVRSAYIVYARKLHSCTCALLCAGKAVKAIGKWGSKLVAKAREDKAYPLDQSQQCDFGEDALLSPTGIDDFTIGQ
jgi:hypothetical protein